MTATTSELHGIAQVRLARATKRLDEAVRFYRDGLGLPVLGGFEAHDGYDGAMIGLPGPDRHLELTQSADVAASVPGAEDLLVFYYADAAVRDGVVERLASLGHPAVRPENPYWIGKAITVADPDGFRVVLFAGRWVPSPGEVPVRFRSPSLQLDVIPRPYPLVHPLADGSAPTSRSYWVVPGRFLAGAYPGHPDPKPHAGRVAALFEAGVRTIVTMMEEDEQSFAGPFVPYLADFERLAQQRGELVRCLRFPTVDGTSPSRDAMRGALDAVDLSIESGRMVFVHCFGGIGRTGTVVACWLRRHGYATKEDVFDVLATLRRGDPERSARRAPESADQRALVLGWGDDGIR